MTRGVKHFWNFIEARHGKGEHDGIEACVERAFSREELIYEGGTILEKAETIVQWCNSMMGPGNISKSMVSRYFWLIHEPNIQNFQDCCTLTRSSEMHSFRSSNAKSLAIRTRKFACFFSSCMHHLWDKCESKEWVDQWSSRYLHPIDSYQLLTTL